jgi:hypothetical protein
MTEIKFYRCDFCSKEYSTQGMAKWCEDSHEKDIEISSVVYEAKRNKGMPSQIKLENKERTKLAVYNIVDVVERT